MSTNTHVHMQLQGKEDKCSYNHYTHSHTHTTYMVSVLWRQPVMAAIMSAVRAEAGQAGLVMYCQGWLP